MDSTATVPTASASKYLQQLCKHWSHRFAVDFDADHGSVSLPGGTLTLDAGPAALTLRLAAPDAATLDRAEAGRRRASPALRLPRDARLRLGREPSGTAHRGGRRSPPR